jgi:hypothetical protein
MTYLLKGYPGWSIVAAGFVLVLWSLLSISIAHGMRPEHALYRFNLLMIELAVLAMPAGIVFIAAGICWQFATFARRSATSGADHQVDPRGVAAISRAVERSDTPGYQDML